MPINIRPVFLSVHKQQIILLIHNQIKHTFYKIFNFNKHKITQLSDKVRRRPFFFFRQSELLFAKCDTLYQK